MEQSEGTTKQDSKEQNSTLPTTVEIDGQEVTLEELKNGYLRQSDYTKKTQKLSEREKELEKKQANNTITEDEKEALEWLKKNGVPTDFNPEKFKELIKNEVESEQTFRNLVRSNPELAKHEKAIKDLQKQTGSAYEDVIVNYGFASKDKLDKAKAQSVMVGDSGPQKEKPKGIRDMTNKEYKEWKSRNLKGSGAYRKASSF